MDPADEIDDIPEDEAEGQEGLETEDQDDDGAVAAAEEEPEAPESGSTDDPPPRQTRKERQRDRQANFSRSIRERDDQIATLRAEIAEMQGRSTQALDGVAESTRAVADAVARQAQGPQKTRQQEIRERLRGVAKKVNPETGAGTEDYLDATADMIVEAEERAQAAAAAALDKLRKEMPAPRNPANAKYEAMAPWLANPKLNTAVELEIDRLVDKGAGGRQRNMRDPKVRDATITEAIHSVAERYGQEVNGPARERRQDRSAAVRGAGARSHPGGGAAQPELSAFQMQLADNHPVFKALPKAQRYAAMRKLVARESASRGQTG